MPVKPKTPPNPWKSGSFYLVAFVIVVSMLGVIAARLPWYALPLVLIAGAIFLPIIGALQLRNDDQLRDKSFVELMGIVIKQLPLLKGRDNDGK